MNDAGIPLCLLNSSHSLSAWMTQPGSAMPTPGVSGRGSSVLPLLFLAAWSRVWLGWGALVLVAIALFWMWLNARIFPVPKSTHNWVSKGVFGERVWINRQQVPIPSHHRHVPQFLTVFSAIGMVMAIWGLYTLELTITIMETVLIYIGKLWFFDRMVWLYEDMKTATPDYHSWLY